jgi:hypothetical protein
MHGNRLQQVGMEGCGSGSASVKFLAISSSAVPSCRRGEQYVSYGSFYDAFFEISSSLFSRVDVDLWVSWLEGLETTFQHLGPYKSPKGCAVLPHLHRDRAHSCHICTGTGRTQRGKRFLYAASLGCSTL